MKWNLTAARWLQKSLRPTRLLQGQPPRPSVRLRLEPLESRWMPTVFTVTDTSDSASDTGSLRHALSNLASGSNTINFAIGSAGSVQTIAPASAFPAIAHQVSILGYTQSGSGYTGPPLIVLNGSSAGAGSNGLNFAAGSSGSEVQGLVIQGFKFNGILINATSGNLIVGNYIGTDIHGTTALLTPAPAFSSRVPRRPTQWAARAAARPTSSRATMATACI